ncbi:fungal-specific transcription factor domain-containing protein [Pseudoneurospora amorphoporcata]|uniref:Fungal-specific transcription factor domain-containing protein n=1 Tax=Pseudoneurospora amorphoporcata TaxID=241081 RepID=A0AAN6P2N9_9PEZI|nr:fungal-specific transcription factor domain-containing protein [Pseudoneurospora amorphoporcata]
MAQTRAPMKNRQKSRSGCRTCKIRRLRCDETKPGCRNCAQKGFECPGYQQRLQWSTKHEVALPAQPTEPENFEQLITAASASIVPSKEKPPSSDVHDATPTAKAPVQTPPANHAETPPPSASFPTPSISYLPLYSPGTPAKDQDGLYTPMTTQHSHDKRTFRQPSKALALTQPVVDIRSFLIEHWFKSVCTSWSAYDSNSNPYRRLTSVLWNSSPPVFYALQSISAASLVEKLPAVMRETARMAPRLATEAIKAELVSFFNGQHCAVFPRGLLLSLFCMSSSMCWMEARQLGQQYLRQARAVLQALSSWTLSPEDQELLTFFNGCLIYEEMLRSVVSDDEDDFRNMLSWPDPPLPTGQGTLIPSTPHPWTGVSADVFRLFGKAIALCRRSRSRWRHNDGTTMRVLQSAMKNIEEATRIEEALLAIDVPTDDEDDVDDPTTSTDLVRNRHAANTAPNINKDLRLATETYRLCSLLQLYESFPDLAAKRIPDLSLGEEDVPDPAIIWTKWVSPLALHVTEILDRIPASSLRCIQPLLCLCAGSGLRFDSKMAMGQGEYSYLLSLESSSADLGLGFNGLGIPGLTAGIGSGPGSSSSFSCREEDAQAVKISQARSILIDRLGQLELSLPPKPIGVAKQLLRAVWSAYDEEIDTPRRTHWLDVMSQTGLHSLFG